ncbi:helix-turn-helix domain-containing protein [Meridianimarinicoccus sp. MJW13]|uniref:helix-turn-helix domain-containing protein n=1 Tax=Meridianimarinicoccus sp. MJW13 TaxID=2720031 RepID=UPI0018694610|nr:helix-turn-helix domain-containing protein [Fluviibacterium sp. MJW13]
MSDTTTRKSRQILAERVEKSSLTSSQKQIFRILLFKFYNVKDGRCFPSDRQIQARTNLNERTIRRARKALVDGGWIICTQAATDKRRRNYRFPKLDAMICSAKHPDNCSPSPELRNRTKSPEKADRMSSIPIYTKTTQMNQGANPPPGRFPVAVGSPENDAWDRFLRNAALPSLSEIFPPSEFSGKLVFWLKDQKIPRPNSVDHRLAVFWFSEEANNSKINQTERKHG